MEQNATDPDTQYTPANTYKNRRGEEAGKLYLDLLKQIELLPKQKAADVAHNAGNGMMAAKDYAKAVELYKEALRRNALPTMKLGTTLALAQKLLEQQNNQEQNQDQNQDQNQEQDKEQEQGQDQKDNEDKEQNQEDSNEEQQEERMSQHNAEQIRGVPARWKKRRKR